MRRRIVERLGRRQRVVDVAEVDAGDELLRRQVGEELPERLSLELRVQVPDGVDDRGRREVDDALLRPEPAQLAVGDEPPPEPSEVADELLDGRADDVRHERLDRGDADLGAAADREREPVARQPVRIVGLECDVGRRVVRDRFIASDPAPLCDVGKRTSYVTALTIRVGMRGCF